MIDKLEFSPQPGINVIIGNNGAGKTSILESLYLLVRNRSFRTNKIHNLINRSGSVISITATINQESGYVQHVLLNKSQKSTHLSINGTKQSNIINVAQTVPIGIITPDIQKLVSEGPKQRRRLLDWCVFHVEQNFTTLVSRYNKILSQRNKSLSSEFDSNDIWDNQLDEIASEITRQRLKTFEGIYRYIKQEVCQLFSTDEFELTFSQGWDQTKRLKEVLDKTLKSDKKRGYTSVGAHRADIRLHFSGKSAKDVLSNGEQKALSAIMILCCLKFIADCKSENPILLCDDIFSELDTKRLNFIFNLIVQQENQTFITSLPNNMGCFSAYPVNMFHVEQGRFV